MDLVLFYTENIEPEAINPVAHQVAALLRFSRIVGRVVIVGGSAEAVEQLRAGVVSIAGVTTDRCPILVEPRLLGLSNERLAEWAPLSAAESTHAPAAAFRPVRNAVPLGAVSAAQIARGRLELADHIERALQARFAALEPPLTSGCAWWVRNPHRCSNPALATVLVEAAGRTGASSQAKAGLQPTRVVVHIDALMTLGRLGRVAALRASGLQEIFPNGAATAYTAHNELDAAALRASGINVVTHAPPVFGTLSETSEARHRLDLTFDSAHDRAKWRARIADTTESLPHEARWWYVPAEPTRASNILETALLAALAEEPTVLLVRGDGTALPSAEQPYLKLVRHAFEERCALGVLGARNLLETHGVPPWAATVAADAQVCSALEYETSAAVHDMMPGQALPTFVRQHPLTAAALPNALHLAGIRVPWRSPSLSEPVALWRFRFTERLDRLRAFLDARSLDLLHEHLERVAHAETVELALLLPHMQFAYLRDARYNAAFRADLRALNAEILLAIAQGMGASTRFCTPREPAPTDPRMFAHTFDGLVTQQNQPPTATLRSNPTLETLRRVCTLASQSLLLD